MMTRLYAMTSDYGAGFAQASSKAASYRILKDSFCPSCSYGAVRRYPMEIEWEVGSTEVADMFYVLFGGLLAKATLAEALWQRFGGIEFSMITMHQDPSLDVATPTNRQDRILLPYDGPELLEIVPLLTIEANDCTIVRTSHRECGKCGRLYHVYGEWANRGGFPSDRYPEDEEMIIVDCRVLGKRPLFRLIDYFPLICSAEFKMWFEDIGLQGVRFAPCGRVE